jgi:hypothetical protein
VPPYSKALSLGGKLYTRRSNTTNIRKLLYVIAAILAVLDVAFGKFWGLWAIIVVTADPGFYANRWNAVLAVLTALLLALARFGVFPDGAKLAVVSAIACLVVALVNRFQVRRQHNSQRG